MSPAIVLRQFLSSQNRRHDSQNALATLVHVPSRATAAWRIQSLWLPSIQGQLALDKKNPAAALTALQAATPIELGLIPFLNNPSCLYHVYIRGQAYLAAGQGNAAAAEFQKILDHSGIVWNCWTGALAHLSGRTHPGWPQSNNGQRASQRKISGFPSHPIRKHTWVI
ncbi:MAG: hypothetical protein ABSE40_22765 [Candidatus Sulfotelmatobacter sp.]|jgi:hypothetical protein